jgi:hypothetical protein
VIYVRASLGRAGLIGHIDGTTATMSMDDSWLADDYTILNHLHSAIDDDVADMFLAIINRFPDLKKIVPCKCDFGFLFR